MNRGPQSRARRHALAMIAALAAAGAGGIRSFAKSAPPAGLLTRTIPVSGEAMPAVGLGTYRSFDIGGEASEREPAREVMRLFAAGGGRLLDSSPMYGRAEAVIGELAADLGLGPQFFYATKVWTRGREQGVRQMEQSFQRMGVRRMDLMQVHNLLDAEVHLATLRDWKASGRLRYIGVTHYTESAYDALEQTMRGGGLDFVQFNYSLAERGAERRLLPLARDLGIAVIVNRPFAKGLLFRKVQGLALPAWAAEFGAASWAQLFLKFILADPAVTCAIPATRKPKHLLDNLGAGRGPLPDAAARRKIMALVAGW